MEKARLTGSIDPVQSFLIEELRAVVSLLGEDVPRLPTTSRLFFSPVEEFLIDDFLPSKVPGRVARGSLARIWSWIEREGAPADVAQFALAIATPSSPSADFETDLAAVSEAHRAIILARVLERIEEAKLYPDRRRKLTARVGGDRIFADLEDVLSILNHQSTLAEFSAALPVHIDVSSPEDIAKVNGVLARANQVENLMPALTAILIRARTEPSKLARLAVSCCGTDDLRTLSAVPAGRLIDVMLSDVEWVAERTMRSLSSVFDNGAPQTLREYHHLSRQLRAAIDLDTQPSDWARRLTEIRSRLSAQMTRELGELLALLRRSIRTQRAVHHRGPAVPDDADLERAISLLELLDVARLAISELAVNEIVSRTHTDVLAYVDQTTNTLTEELRTIRDARRDHVLANAAAMVRVQEALHGHAQSALIRRGFEVAAGSSLPKRASVA